MFIGFNGKLSLFNIHTNPLLRAKYLYMHYCQRDGLIVETVCNIYYDATQKSLLGG